VTVITTHLGELVRQHAWELLGRAETKRLMDGLNESHPKLLEELVPKLLTLARLAAFSNNCCASGFNTDLATILEVLLETASMNKNVVALVEAFAPGFWRGV